MVTLHGLVSGQVLQRRPSGASITFHLEGHGSTLPQVTLPVGRSEITELGENLVEVRLSQLPPGGPFSLKVGQDDLSTIEVEFFVGDLWLLAGQSNMEGVGLLDAAAQPHALVRSFSMARRWVQAVEPLHLLGESPDAIHHQGFPFNTEQASAARSQATRGSGVGLHFARRMVERTGVPQGLICVAHGGTSMAQWSPDGELYASMMRSLDEVGQPLAGVLWYQGCSDTNTAEDAEAYTRRTLALVRTLRCDLEQPRLPWLVVQIGTEIGRTTGLGWWHSVQEQQRVLPTRLPNLDVCAAADLEHDDWIHVSGRAFPKLADRLAVLADRLVLRRETTYPAPQPVRVRWDPDATSPALLLECQNVVEPWTSSGLPLGFALRDGAGRDRPLIYQVRAEGKAFRLRLTDDDLVGLCLYHGVGAQPQINTCDSRGLPLPVFGPLSLEGLPPLSPWFREWSLGPLVARPLETLGTSDFEQTKDWEPRTLEGWNVVNQHEAWGHGDFCQLAQTVAVFDQPTTFQILAGGDGPLRVWSGTELVIDDPTSVRDLSTVRASKSLTASAGTSTLTVAMNNRGGQSWGFYLRLRFDPGAVR